MWSRRSSPGRWHRRAGRPNAGPPSRNEKQLTQGEIDWLVDALADRTLPSDEIRVRLPRERVHNAALRADVETAGQFAKATGVDP